MTDILRLARIQLAAIILFASLKFIRPSVLESNAPEWIKVSLLSLPNFFEAVIGILLLTGIGLYLNGSVFSPGRQIKPMIIYTLALVLAAVYVLTQEFKIHNLGGNNVFDINDVIFSIAGLLVGFLIVLIIKPAANPAK